MNRKFRFIIKQSSPKGGNWGIFDLQHQKLVRDFIGEMLALSEAQATIMAVYLNKKLPVANTIYLSKNIIRLMTGEKP